MRPVQYSRRMAIKREANNSLTPEKSKKFFILKYSLFIFFVPLFIILVSWSFRKPITTWVLKNYMDSQGFQLSFEFQTFNLNEIKVLNLNLDEEILIPLIQIEWTKSFVSFFDLSSVKIEIEKVNLSTLSKLNAALSNTEEKKESLSFHQALEFCEWLKPLPIGVSLKQLVVENQTHHVGLLLNHSQKQTDFKISFQTELRTRIEPNAAKGELQIDCNSERIKGALTSFKTQIPQFLLKDQMMIKDITLESEEGYIQWLKSNQASVKLNFKLKGWVEKDQLKFDFNIPSLTLKTPFNPKNPLTEKLSVVIRRMSIGGEHSLFFERVRMTFLSFDPQQMNFNAQLNLRNIDYKNTKSKIEIKGIDSTTNLVKVGDQYRLESQISDRKKTLFISQMIGSYSPETWSVKIPPQKASLKLGKSVLEIFPFFKKHIKSLDGKLHLSGSVSQQLPEKMLSHLRFKGENMNIDSSFGEFKGIDWQHDIKSFDTFQSSPYQKLSIKKVSIGRVIDNVIFHYQINNQQEILAHKLHLQHDGMKLDAVNFEVNPTHFILKNFKAKLTQLQLEKLLAMALGQKVTADGTLSGEIQIEYGNRKVEILGNLDSDQAGWVRYRGAEYQVSGLQLSDTPMTILNNYLYNFHFQTLALKIRTEKNFDMIAVLAANGHNPDYLNGRPLKLNINLEKNLLATLRFLVLTRDLPANLQEIIKKQIGE